MQSSKVIARWIFVVSLLFPLVLLAQEATPEPEEPLGISEILEIVREAYPDALIVEIFLDDEDDDTNCWQVEFADDHEICVDAVTGEITDDADDDADDADATPEPQATNDADDTDDGDVTPDPQATDEADDDDSNDGDATPEPQATDEADGDDSDDDGEGDDSDDDSPTTPVVTLEEVVEVALGIFPNSAITSVDLELWDDGTLVWDVELDDDVRSVDVDAATGEVLSFGFETEDDNSVQTVDDDDHSDDDSAGSSGSSGNGGTPTDAGSDNDDDDSDDDDGDDD